MKRSKERIPKIEQRRSRAITVQEALKKSLILLLQFWINEGLGLLKNGSLSLSLSLSPLYPFHLSLSLFPSLYLSFYLSFSLSPSLSLLSIILFGVSNGRFRPCSYISSNYSPLSFVSSHYLEIFWFSLN